jgi:uncharacterized protein DUF3237
MACGKPEEERKCSASRLLLPRSGKQDIFAKRCFDIFLKLAWSPSFIAPVDLMAPVGADTKRKFEPPKPELEFMGRVIVDLAAPAWELGATSDLGRRRIIPITGGALEGPLLKGEILNSGADWQVVTADGLAIIDTRYLLRLDDGSLAYLQTRGYRHGPADVIAELAKGAEVDPSRYYFRVYLNFETSSSAYAWLNRTLAIGYAMRSEKAVIYDAYAIR